MEKESASRKMFLTAEQTALALVSDDELSEERLMQLFGNLTTSGELACDVLADVAGRLAMIDTRMKQLNDYKATLKNVDERIKNSIKRSLEMLDTTNLDCGVYRLTLAKNPGKLIEAEGAETPAQYLIYVPATTTADKKAILKALRDGEEIPGFSIETGTNLRIK